MHIAPQHLETALQRISQIEHRLQAINNRTEHGASAVGSQPENTFETILNQIDTTNSPSRQNIESLINQISQDEGVDPNLIKAVVQTESAFNPKAVSHVGAQGLMQLMPSTARGLGVEDSFNAADNLSGGTRYLKGQISKYQSLPKALAAYNAGPGAVDKYGGIPPYQETQNYVKKVMALYESYAHSPNANTAAGGRP